MVKSPRKFQLRNILVLVLMVMPCACCCNFFIIEEYTNTKWRAFSDSCDGKAVAEAVKYNKQAGLHPIVYFNLDKRGKRWEATRFRFFTTPAEWLPESSQKTELIACFTEEAVTIETCEYGLNFHSSDKKLLRKQFEIYLVLREAQTGEVVTKHTFQGSTPARCDMLENFEDRKSVV